MNFFTKALRKKLACTLFEQEEIFKNTYVAPVSYGYFS